MVAQRAGRQALPGRGAGRQRRGSPQHHRGLRRRPAPGRPPLPGHGVPDRAQPVRGDGGARHAPHRSRLSDHPRRRPGHPRRPRRRHHPPRPQARQRHVRALARGRGRDGQGPRLRHLRRRRADRGRGPPHRPRPRARHPRVHGPRAGQGQGRHRAVRCLRARRDALRVPGRRAALRLEQPRRDHGPQEHGEGPVARRAPPRRPEGPGHARRRLPRGQPRRPPAVGPRIPAAPRGGHPDPPRRRRARRHRLRRLAGRRARARLARRLRAVQEALRSQGRPGPAAAPGPAGHRPVHRSEAPARHRRHRPRRGRAAVGRLLRRPRR